MTIEDLLLPAAGALALVAVLFLLIGAMSGREGRSRGGNWPPAPRHPPPGRGYRPSQPPPGGARAEPKSPSQIPPRQR